MFRPDMTTDTAARPYDVVKIDAAARRHEAELETCATFAKVRNEKTGGKWVCVWSAEDVETVMNPPALHAFFVERQAEFPSALRWALDKLRHVIEAPLKVEGRVVNVESWVFEGRFSRRQTRFWKQYDQPGEGAQFAACLAVQGGEYRGQRQLVTIRLTRYWAADGKPLPR